MTVTPSRDPNQEVRKASSILEEVFPASSLEVIQSRSQNHVDASQQVVQPQVPMQEQSTGSNTGAPPQSVQNLLGLAAPG